MKKLSLVLLCVAAFLAAPAPAHAQSDPNPVGTIMLSGNIGLKFVKDMYSKVNVGPAPSVAFDYVVLDSIWKGHLFQVRFWRNPGNPLPFQRTLRPRRRAADIRVCAPSCH